MEKIKERGKIYALHKASDKLNDYYGSAMLGVVQFDGNDIQCAYVDGYLQAEQHSEVKEMEEPSKDLDKEIRRYRMNNPIIGHREESLYDYITNVAKHFFELGLKAQKGG